MKALSMMTIAMLSMCPLAIAETRPPDLRPLPTDYSNQLPAPPPNIGQPPPPPPSVPKIDIQIGPGYFGGRVTVPF